MEKELEREANFFCKRDEFERSHGLDFERPQHPGAQHKRSISQPLPPSQISPRVPARDHGALSSMLAGGFLFRRFLLLCACCLFADFFLPCVLRPLECLMGFWTGVWLLLSLSVCVCACGRVGRFAVVHDFLFGASPTTKPIA